MFIEISGFSPNGGKSLPSMLILTRLAPLTDWLKTSSLKSDWFIICPAIKYLIEVRSITNSPVYNYELFGILQR